MVQQFCTLSLAAVALSFALTSCNADLKVQVSGSMPPATGDMVDFRILNGTLITNRDPSISWMLDSQGEDTAIEGGVEVVLAKDEGCLVEPRRHDTIVQTETTLKELDDGIYHLCLFANVSGTRLAATNNGVSITVDRTAPKITLAGTHSASEPIVLNPQVEDLTTVSYSWTIVGGPGAMTIEPANGSSPLLSFTTPGVYEVLLTVNDAAGNQATKSMLITYGKPSAFVSLNRKNEATDGWINHAERLATAPLWELTAVGSVTAAYTVPLDEAANPVCDASLSYVRTSIPGAADLASDKTWSICVRLTDAQGHVSYGKSQAVTRDVVAPILTLLAKTNEAADGYVNDGEKSSSNLAWQIGATGYDSAWYTSPLDNTMSVACNGSLTYDVGFPAKISDLASDAPWIICVKLSDNAGNVAYGKSESVVRDVGYPTFTSFLAINEGSDGFINSGEVAATNPLWDLVSSGHASVAYTAPLDDSSPVTCDGLKTYDQPSVPRAIDLGSDKPWIICAKIADAAGNTLYRKSAVVNRVAGGPIFTSLVRANEGSDGYVNDAEKSATNPLWTLNAAGHVSAKYTIALDDTASVTCDSGKTYGQSTIPGAADLASDKPWVVCVELKDAASNVVYGKSQVVTRDVSSPVFTSLNRQNAGADGYVNDSEKSDTLPLWVLAASGHNAVAYTGPLDETSSHTCDASQTYSQSVIAAAVDLADAQKPFVICVRLSDAAGNVIFGKSQVVTRDTVLPTFTSLVKANEGSDGYVNDSERNATNPLWTLTAGGQDTTEYTLALDDAAPVTCSGQTFGQPSVPRAADLGSDKPWVVCVKLSDAAGNVVYGKSEVVTRDVAAPVFTSLSGVNEGANGSVNDAEKNATNPLWLLSASGHASAVYTAALDDTTPVTCDAGRTYGPTSVPRAADLGSDKPWVICVKLTDDAGNVSYGKSQVVVRDTGIPTFTSLVKANEASDGYVNNAEKNATNPLWTLSASGQDTTQYTAALDDTLTVTCDGGQSYGSSVIPGASSLTADKPWIICVKLSDAAGNVVYGKSEVVTRDIDVPGFVALSLKGSALDGYINDSEKAHTTSLWLLDAFDFASVNFTSALDDTTPVTCDAAKTYSQSSIARAVDLPASDKPYVICAKLSDFAGNVTYGKSAVVTRDVVYPVFTSLALANEALDGKIDGSEVAATNPLWTLTASGHAAVAYTTPLDDTTPATCGSGHIYSQSTIASASNLGADLPYMTCVRLMDAAGNTTYGKSAIVTRDTVYPVVGGGGAITLQSIMSTSASLSWTKAVDATTTQATLQYRVYYSTSSSFDSLAQVKAGTAANAYATDINSLTVTGLTPETSYYFNVLVKDGDGNESVYAKVSGRTPLDGFVQVSPGALFSCGLSAEGKAYCWGDDTHGQLGNGAAGASDIPTAVDTSDRFRKIAVGYAHACALRTDNKILCWGRALQGVLGNGDAVTNQQSPVLVSGTYTYRDVTAGSDHTCAIRTDGVPLCWGDDTDGRLGNGAGITVDQYTPSAISTLTHVTEIHAGKDFTCALKASGEAYCWGKNDWGQLGIGSAGGSRDAPTAVAGGHLYKKIATMHSSTHACGINASGNTFCWGADQFQQIGDANNSFNFKPTPAPVAGGHAFRDIAPGATSTCGVTTAGLALCWGLESQGSLGNGGDAGTHWDTPQWVSGGLKFRTIAAANSRGCGIIGNGKGYCWGNNASGVLGIGGTTNQLTPAQVSIANMTGGAAPLMVAGGLEFSCVLKSNGKVYCWGSDTLGQLGDDATLANKASPVLVALSEPTIHLSAGDATACAVGISGNLRCWGSNHYDTLGIAASVTHSPTPVLIGTTSHRWLSSAGGDYHYCALRDDGFVHCWGRNDTGQLGLGTTTTSEDTPQQISTDVFVQLSAHEAITCGINWMGTARCWGYNNYRLGNGSAANSASAVDFTVATNVTHIVNGEAQTCVLTAAGTIYCVGNNFYGQIGDGTNTFVTTPKAVDSSNQYISVATGSSTTCGIRANGRGYCWGNDTLGAVGNDAAFANQYSPVAVALPEDLKCFGSERETKFAITGTGKLYGWGLNDAGQLADGPLTGNAATPRLMEGN